MNVMSFAVVEDNLDHRHGSRFVTNIGNDPAHHQRRFAACSGEDHFRCAKIQTGADFLTEADHFIKPFSERHHAHDHAAGEEPAGKNHNQQHADGNADNLDNATGLAVIFAGMLGYALRGLLIGDYHTDERATRDRLERDSNLQHRPLTALVDQPLSGQIDAGGRVLWELH